MSEALVNIKDLPEWTASLSSGYVMVGKDGDVENYRINLATLLTSATDLGCSGDFTCNDLNVTGNLQGKYTQINISSGNNTIEVRGLSGATTTPTLDATIYDPLSEWKYTPESNRFVSVSGGYYLIAASVAMDAVWTTGSRTFSVGPASGVGALRTIDVPNAGTEAIGSPRAQSCVFSAYKMGAGDSIYFAFEGENSPDTGNQIKVAIRRLI